MSYYGGPPPPPAGFNPQGAYGGSGYPPGAPGGYPGVTMPEPFAGGAYPPGGGAGYPPSTGAPGYPAAPGGPAYPPQSSGYPPATGYPAAAPGYPAAAPGYPAASTGYPATNPSYPAANPSYPAATGYPAANPGYPAASYPPANPSYPAANPSYPAASYPAAGPSYPATGPSYPAASGPGYAPGASGYGGPAPTPGYPGGAPAGYAATSQPTIQMQGTLRPYPSFNAEQDSQALRKAMKGIGTDEQAIINVLCQRSNDQRQKIKLQYKTMFGRDLVKDLKSELSHNFLQAILALMMTPAEYDAEELHKAISGLGTNEETLVEILASRSNARINEIKSVYKTLYKRELEKDLMSDTSGHFRKLLVALCTGGRSENTNVDMELARRDAMELYQAGEKKVGTDESKFNQIFCARSHAHIRVVLDEYRKVANRSLEQSVRSEMSCNLEMGMLAIISIASNPFAFFAQRLYNSMKGGGTKDDTLIRVIVSRCEIDMVQIKQEFQRAYGKTLESFIQDDTSGDYRKALMTLVRG